MISFRHKGSFKNLELLFEKANSRKYFQILDKYGKEGVQALSEATPVDSGLTASSWSYSVIPVKGGARLVWNNSNRIGGVPVAILIQYGHATGNGGYVEGRDFINPAIQPILDKIANDIWKEVAQ